MHLPIRGLDDLDWRQFKRNLGLPSQEGGLHVVNLDINVLFDLWIGRVGSKVVVKVGILRWFSKQATQSMDLTYIRGRHGTTGNQLLDLESLGARKSLGTRPTSLVDMDQRRRVAARGCCCGCSAFLCCSFLGGLDVKVRPGYQSASE